MTDTPATPHALPPQLGAQLRSMAGDMTFLAIFEIVIGALYCLTIIGAAIGVPMIFAGLRLKESAESFTSYIAASESSTLRSALDRLGRHFHIHKILVIISIGLTIVYILFMLVIVGLVLGGMGSGDWE